MPANRRAKALEFMEGISQLASSCVKEELHRLPENEQREIRRFALRVLQDSALKKKEKLRNGTVRLFVALLPDTFPVLEKLLADCSSLLWYEVHFMIFAALDRDDLKPNDQRRVLQMIHRYLTDVSSGAGFAAWKAGDLLGDEWRDSQTVRMLEELLFSARHAAGRKAALHGIEHALNKATPSESQHLFALVQKAAAKDRSAEVRLNAQLALKGVGCGPPLSSVVVHQN